MNKQRLILHLSLISSVGPHHISKLAKVLRKEKNPASWYTYRQQDFMRFGMSDTIAQKIVAGLADDQILEQELDLIQKHKISWVTILDDDYPALLKEIHVPPSVLYWKGQPVWHDTDQAISFVGARKGNNYGQRAIAATVPALVKAGWIIVSGGAYGIDTMAHRAAVSAGGKTIVVIGAGLLQPYLAGNQRLFEQVIVAGGVIVSSFPLREVASAWTFPKRNRIIAGLSQGCVVVQAAKKSGALITSSFALQEGRQVFAVPGPFDDDLSVGCNALLKEGAKLVQNAQDIMEEFGVLGQQDIQEQMEITDVSEPKLVKDVKQDEPVHPILVHCAVPTDLADLIQKTGQDESKLKSELFDLQLEGKIQQDFAGLWQVV
jgi:DNA processing protein